jgi:hypothetical protein
MKRNKSSYPGLLEHLENYQTMSFIALQQYLKSESGISKEKQIKILGTHNMVIDHLMSIYQTNPKLIYSAIFTKVEEYRKLFLLKLLTADLQNQLIESEWDDLDD